MPQWMRYLALDQLLLNSETGLVRGIGDDYGFYRGVSTRGSSSSPTTSTPSSTRATAAAQINDSIFSNIEGNPGSGGDGVDGLRKLLSNKDIIPQYYQAFVDLIRDIYNPTVLNPLIDRLLGPSMPATTIASIKQFIVNRSQAVLAQIPRSFSTNSAAGLQRLPPHHVAHRGPQRHRRLGDDALRPVNGQPANWCPRTGTWSLAPSTGSTTTLVPTASTWKYLVTAGDPAPRGATPSSTTRSGPRRPAGSAGATGRRASSRSPRPHHDLLPQTFTVANPAAYSALTLRLCATTARSSTSTANRLHQQHAGRHNYLTRPTAVVSGSEETQYFTFSIDPAKLRAGDNVLAVEVHDAVNSSDLTLDVGLDATTAGGGSGGGVALNPGINRLVVQAFDGPNGTGNEVNRTFVDVWYDAPTASTTPPAPVDAVSLLTPDSYRPRHPVLVQASTFVQRRRAAQAVGRHRYAHHQPRRRYAQHQPGHPPQRPGQRSW